MNSDRETKLFLSGNWHAYKIQEQENITFTPSSVSRKLNQYFDDFKVVEEVFGYSDMLCIRLSLETVNKSKTNATARKKKNDKPLITKFKLAFSPEDQILFCHRLIPAKIRTILLKVLEAESLILMNLSGSQPDQLLAFRRQAKFRKEGFEILDKVYNEESENEVFSIIGPEMPQVPRIKKLSCSITSTPFGNEKMEKTLMNDVSVELSGPSVYHCYLSLAKKNILKSVPTWISKARTSGKTHMTLSVT